MTPQASWAACVWTNTGNENIEDSETSCFSIRELCKNYLAKAGSILYYWPNVQKKKKKKKKRRRRRNTDDNTRCDVVVNWRGDWLHRSMYFSVQKPIINWEPGELLWNEIVETWFTRQPFASGNAVIFTHRERKAWVTSTEGNFNISKVVCASCMYHCDS